MIAQFDARHNDPLSKSLRPAAQKILEKDDKRLNGCRSTAETLDRAFALAFHDLPQNKARMGPSKILAERDAARESATARIQKKMASRV